MEKKKVLRKKKEIDSLIDLTIEHNGYCGGDTGHGGFVNITLDGSKFDNADLLCNGEEVEKINFGVRGDWERDALINSFKHIIKELEK